jgi:sugar/nucleoside kinase (ribokinase family)
MSVAREAPLLFVGAAGLDTVSVVESFPFEDAKVRALKQTITGGGNAANSATAAQRLGADTFLLSAIGDDHAAQLIIEELVCAGISTELIVSKHGSNSGTTFVIVSQATATRTCIHNAMINELTPSDIDLLFSQETDLLNKFTMVHFDSRHTLASIALAKRLRPSTLVSIDIEKMRPHVEHLLPYCDIIFCNQHFPSLVLGPCTNNAK